MKKVCLACMRSMPEANFDPDREDGLCDDCARPPVPPEQLIHIRKRPDAPGIEAVFCGKTLVASVTEAFGYWGPAGDGFDRICKECFALAPKKP